MQRITITLDDALAGSLNRMAKARGYLSRSEAVRDLVRAGLENWRGEQGEGEQCVANLSYVVDRRVRALPQRLAEMQHANHDLIGASTVVRLDHHHSLESVILKGASHAVREFADQVRAERGVFFSALNLLSVARSETHEHDHDHHHDGHDHLSPIV